MSEFKKNLVIDVVAIVVYAVVANPALTGIGLHEWLSLGVFVAFLVHVAMHVDWVVDACRSGFGQGGLARTGNLVLDVLILVVFAVCVVSGLMVSGALLQAFGVYATGYFFWDPLHAASAKALLALLLVHVVAHWGWISHMVFRKKGRTPDA